MGQQHSPLFRKKSFFLNTIFETYQKIASFSYRLFINIHGFFGIDFRINFSLKFDEKRPVAVASINLDPEPYDELRDLLSNNPARPASIYLKTSKFQEDSKGIIRVKNTGLCLDISDLSWRYPIL